MNKKEKKNLIQLYEQYSFRVEEEYEDEIVFSYREGYFYNAEIVRLANSQEQYDELKKKYEESGYAVREIYFKSFEQEHKRLFNGFFNVNNSRKRLQNEYQNFYNLQTQKMFGVAYEYVEPSYFIGSEYQDSQLIDMILKQITKEGPQLIILEAAAGYGKTCTSYELVRHMIEKNEFETLIFTELSKNRRASLFRYVLLDEIDKKFTNLSSDLVLWEIKNGNVPLIIDGFDELLSKANSGRTQTGEHDENAQTMLDTIAELFDDSSKAKVILTSRKSSILTGKEFEEWSDLRLKDCQVTRMAIENPSVKDWIGNDKFNFLEENDIPIESITNPILLSYMKNLTMEEFSRQFKNSKCVLDCYFNFLLERERDRQSLILRIDEQYQIMIQLAGLMVQFDIHSEEYAFIKDLFKEIIHEKFQEYRERYIQVAEKPSEEQFAAKLAGHALLNRISSNKNEIGFINEFIYGIFIGEAILHGYLSVADIDSQYIDISATAMTAKDYSDKQLYYQKIKPVLQGLNYEQQLDIELKLLGTIDHNYQNHYISNGDFNENVVLVGEYQFINCIFQNCVFERCLLSTSMFIGCSFRNCRFYDVLVDKDTTDNRELTFYGDCMGHDDFCLAAQGDVEEQPQEKDYEVEVLNRFRKGRAIGQMRVNELLIKSANPEEREKLIQAVESLRKKEYISRNGHYWILNRNYMTEIRGMLGMNQ